MTISDDVAEQADQTLRNIASALTEAGASLDDVVRVRYLLPSAGDFEACWPVLRRHLGIALPAATMMVVGARRSPHEDRDEVTPAPHVPTLMRSFSGAGAGSDVDLRIFMRG